MSDRWQVVSSGNFADKALWKFLGDDGWAALPLRLQEPTTSALPPPDDQREGRSRHTGKVTTKPLRPPSMTSQRASPPWRRAICRTSAKPNPVPVVLPAAVGR